MRMDWSPKRRKSRGNYRWGSGRLLEPQRGDLEVEGLGGSIVFHEAQPDDAAKCLLEGQGFHVTGEGLAPLEVFCFDGDVLPVYRRFERGIGVGHPPALGHLHREFEWPAFALTSNRDGFESLEVVFAPRGAHRTEPPVVFQPRLSYPIHAFIPGDAAF